MAAFVALLQRGGFHIQHRRKAIEECAHPLRQRRRDLVHGAASIILKRRADQALHQRAAEIQRCEPLIVSPEFSRPFRPWWHQFPASSSVGLLIDEWKARVLQGGDISPDRALRHAALTRQAGHRFSMAAGFERTQYLPLASHFGVARHVRMWV